MRAIVFTGFLGSGKTSLSLSLAHYLVHGGAQVAFVNNEAGEVPLDGDLLRQKGYTVRELFAGCVCCQVAGDLLQVLQEIATAGLCDTALIEPSGVADPSRLVSLLQKSPVLEQLRVLGIVDGPRFPLLMRVVPRLVAAGLQQAHVVLVNKIDLLFSPGEQEARIEAVKAMFPGKRVIPVSASEGVSPEVWKEVISP